MARLTHWLKSIQGLLVATTGVVLAGAALFAAAGIGRQPGPATSPTPVDSEAPTSSTASAAPGQVGTIAELPGAVIQVEATGVFRPPLEDKEQELAARGSGFIIDSSGTAVTNNHLVTGANTLTVWVGEGRREYPGRLLGASECSDLAVIKIDAPVPLPFLSWYDGKIPQGLEVWAAGFPRGEPKQALTKGIVSRSQGILDESWAWIENSIEHTNPGASGGPVVTEEARVVGVNYAGDDTRNWAIARDEAVGVIAKLRAGQDLYSIGVNGEAVDSVDHPGIWVSSVKPGSQAAKAGLKAGDVITRLAKTGLAVGGTMKEYCQVLRSHNPTDVLPIDVFRTDSTRFLAGEINGTPVVQGFTFVKELLGSEPASGTTRRFESEYDDTGGVGFEVPEEWSDLESAAWTIDKVTAGRSLVASPMIAQFKKAWDTPGVRLSASRSAVESETIDGILDAAKRVSSCAYIGRKDFATGLYTGRYDLWEGCASTDTRLIRVGALGEGGAHMIFVEFQAVTDGDIEVLDRIMATLSVDDLR